MSNLKASWQRTACLLAQAKTLLSPEVVAANATVLQQFDEFMDSNELGLAFEWIKSITYEDQPTCLALLRLLKSAAEEMSLHDNLMELENRITTLGKTFAE
jgi:hypothetical protein